MSSQSGADAVVSVSSLTGSGGAMGAGARAISVTEISVTGTSTDCPQRGQTHARPASSSPAMKTVPQLQVTCNGIAFPDDALDPRAIRIEAARLRQP
jgi:hypothetical protein